MGTIDYMSPEQAMGKEVDGRSDIFSLGCAMYHLITGRLPYPGESPVDRLGKRISGKPVPILEARADVPAELAQVLDRMMAAKPHERYQSGDEVAEALEALARPKTAAAHPRRPSKGSGNAAPRPEDTAPIAVPPAPAAAHSPRVVTLRPKYPRWFVPLAGLAESTPTAALIVFLLALLFVFGAGFAAALLAVPR